MIPNLSIPKTKDTPSVDFSFNTFKCFIEGDSIPENPFEFYYPLINTYEDFIMAYDKELPKVVDFTFDMHYFNTPTLKMLFVLLEKISNLNDLKKLQTRVYWLIDESGEEDLIENLHHLEEMTQVKIHQVINTN